MHYQLDPRRDDQSGEYSGYYVDLASTLASVAGFDHELVVQTVNYDDLCQFSCFYSTPVYNVSSIAVNQVVNQEVDMALADITINLNRVNLVDFTIPTATEGMAIYMKTPDSQA